MLTSNQMASNDTQNQKEIRTETTEYKDDKSPADRSPDMGLISQYQTDLMKSSYSPNNQENLRVAVGQDQRAKYAVDETEYDFL